MRKLGVPDVVAAMQTHMVPHNVKAAGGSRYTGTLMGGTAIHTSVQPATI